MATAPEVLQRLLDEGGELLDGRTGSLSTARLRELALARTEALARETPPLRHRMNRGLFALGVPVLALYSCLREDAGLDPDAALATLDELLAAVYRTRLASPIKRAVAGRAFRLPVVRNAIARAAERAREPGGFVMRRVDGADAGEPPPDLLLALDVERCPLSELFARHGVPEVGPLICKIDDYVADALGLDLQRTGTIAAGAQRCDFRYRER